MDNAVQTSMTAQGRLQTFVTLSEIFRSGNMLCWPERLQSAKSRHWRSFISKLGEIKRCTVCTTPKR